MDVDVVTMMADVDADADADAVLWWCDMMVEPTDAGVWLVTRCLLIEVVVSVAQEEADNVLE